jgi:hypothetical protein
MSFSSPTPRPSRPDAAAAANDAIRRLVDARAGGEWSVEEYEVLLIQWDAAIREEIVEAA